MRRRATARARLIPVPASPDPDSGSSTSVTSPEPTRMQQTHSVLPPVLRAAAAPVAVVEEVAASQAVEGSASSVVTETALNRYLRTYGWIPMARSEAPVDDVDLNALLAPPPPPRRVEERPVICAYCNCAFCFGADEVPSLDPGPGHVYPAPPVPVALNPLMPPAVWPLYRPDPWGPGATPELLLVCSSKHHFRITMGALHQQQPGAAPWLVWNCATCHRVLPIVVGGEGSSSPDLHANPAPALEPYAAGAYWNYVVPEHENMVKLKLHDDPLKLTLGRP